MTPYNALTFPFLFSYWTKTQFHESGRALKTDGKEGAIKPFPFYLFLCYATLLCTYPCTKTPFLVFTIHIPYAPAIPLIPPLAPSYSRNGLLLHPFYYAGYFSIYL